MPLLFSYGSLQQEGVQRALFGRRLVGAHDELVGYETTRGPRCAPAVVAATGSTHHANATFNGRDESRVPGMVFAVTDAELAAVDGYEAADSYLRIAAPLASGREAWVFVHAPRGDALPPDEPGARSTP